MMSVHYTQQFENYFKISEIVIRRGTIKNPRSLVPWKQTSKNKKKKMKQFYKESRCVGK